MGAYDHPPLVGGCGDLVSGQVSPPQKVAVCEVVPRVAAFGPASLSFRVGS